ncbi:MAG: FKBP-type peptidyl-prolyl cis-trans isomerase [Tannerella sp.]|jgi:FKBP-type peptidyl-prolyl cis-trans isomerase|nr:FKBP-type peptidyl-prolyl cis-trans isomerase [Tannerella sp.]
MKRNTLYLAVVAIFVCATSCNTSKKVAFEAAAAPQKYYLASASDSASYAIGLTYGSGLKENMKSFPGGQYSLDALAEGFLRSITDDTAAFVMQPETAQGFIQTYVQEVMVKDAEAEKAKGEAFLEANKQKDGVVTTESGLQFKVLTQGDGALPMPEDKVRVHYTGRLLDGTVFDSSVERGEPAEFTLNQVIHGWTEILQRMPVGSKYQVWIPSELGYGTQGNGPIKPNSVLEFEIELLDIVE